MIEINTLLGVGLIILNLIPIIIKQPKYLQITIPISLLLTAIRVLMF